MNPRYPLFIPSLGRYRLRYTATALDGMRVPYRLVIEEQEYSKYLNAIGDRKKLLVLDKSYQQNYQTCDSHGQERRVGAGAARNFLWDYSISEGHDWHWTMDDNIRRFLRFHKNKRVRVRDGSIFRAMEDFCLRYKNIAMAGPNYKMFVKARHPIAPVQFNTRIYSCNLIRNDIPFRWRGRYNEDTILSLDLLKDGWCTVLFNAFLQDKKMTSVVGGGNTDTLYKGGTLEKSQMMVSVHPDVSKVVKRFRRIHHHVDYRPFSQNKLIRKESFKPQGINNEYGFKFKKGKPNG